MRTIGLTESIVYAFDNSSTPLLMESCYNGEERRGRERQRQRGREGGRERETETEREGGRQRQRDRDRDLSKI